MRFVLPLPPNMANGRMHWRRKDASRKLYEEKCNVWAYTRNEKNARLADCIDRASIRATLFLHNPMDQDNLMARLKWPVDWLVKSGYLAGDDPKRLRWEGVPEQAVDRKNPRVEIEIRRAA